MENLALFLDHIKTITFWQRLFSWRKVRALSYDAFEEYLKLRDQLEQIQVELSDLQDTHSNLAHDKVRLNDALIASEKAGFKAENENQRLSRKVDEISRELTKFQSAEDSRKSEHRQTMDQMLQARSGFEGDRKDLSDKRVEDQKQRLEGMKRQWALHEESVGNRVKNLCQSHIISYVDKVPFRGNPDNTIEVCGEHIIFDAKSPANDDLSNFPNYIKAQAEQASKYTKQESVKRDIFLVIPSNTAQCIEQWSYHMGDYDVFVITPDALEPVLLSLKKLEDYEFVDQLSPEERDNICRIIGQFAHTTKRRLQIEQFFANHALDLIRKCETDLPVDFKKAVLDFEKAEKLNPSSERRSKQILLTDLVDKHAEINSEAVGRQIPIPENFEEIKRLH